MTNRLSGRVALVTGAGSGIGAATAARLRADGAKVLTTDRQGPVDLTMDVTATGASAAMVAATVEKFGGLDILVPCAGITGFHAFETHTDEFWDSVIAINLTAVFRLIRAALPALKVSGKGKIITIGSTLASFGDAGLSAYAASKHGILGLSRSLACELGPFGITVNCVQPGAIETPMTEPAFTAMPEFKAYWEKKAAVGRLGQPEDIANVIAFLVSDEAAFVSGHGIFVDGGAMQRQ